MPTDAATAARTLARYAVTTAYADIPAAARHEAARSLLNWIGCAVGGSQHAAVDKALAALLPFAAGGQCTILGRRERTDALHAALINGLSAHVFDFDDTHLRTLLHPSVPVASALLALAERQPLGGRDFLLAFIVGVEIECRVANAIWFAHNSHWYITGTAGVFGAAAAASRALGLNEDQTTHALGIACAEAAGTREMAGTMTKAFIHGRAAQNGVLAALLAQQGFTSAETSLEGPHGFAHVLAPERDLAALTAGLGTTYEILSNSYKPFACGVVAHPVIDACIQLRNKNKLNVADIEAIALRVSPRALELTGIKEPPNGLKSKWSIYHSAAVALADGAAGEHQYSDERVNAPEVRELRARISATADAQLTEIAAHVTLKLKNGSALEKRIDRVVGSAENPMSDRDLEMKVRGLARGVLPATQTDAMIALAWRIDELADVAEVARAAAAA
ncbi:MAG TPA: MmgE/PrpD family protein [Burkholderiales bacterium]|nr:MmgE/PrpD family protein [Burkholderiales bacterium]